MHDITINQLKRMKGQMAKRGNWKEVERINKMIRFQEDKERRGL
ncbi:MAG: hypothetical protein U9Q92_04260 [archaeon]|nr:hypothetical protein [archaeon]